MNRKLNEHYVSTKKAIFARRDFYASLNLDPYHLKENAPKPFHADHVSSTYVVDWQLPKSKSIEGKNN